MCNVVLQNLLKWPEAINLSNRRHLYLRKAIKLIHNPGGIALERIADTVT